MPELILTRSFWTLWKFQISLVLGFPRLGSLLLVAALSGVLLAQIRATRVLLSGLWAGYVAHSLFFTYHTATHDYYHLLLIPIVALSLGPIADLALRAPRWRPLAVAGLVLWGSISARTGLERLPVPDAEENIRTAQAVGALVHHSTHTILLAEAYALPLRYYGQLSGIVWPDTSTLARANEENENAFSVKERLELIQQEHASEYFIVTELEEFEQQQELRRTLEETYPTLVKTDDYVIFDLRMPRDAFLH